MKRKTDELTVKPTEEDKAAEVVDLVVDTTDVVKALLETEVVALSC